MEIMQTTQLQLLLILTEGLDYLSGTLVSEETCWLWWQQASAPQSGSPLQLINPLGAGLVAQSVVHWHFRGLKKSRTQCSVHAPTEPCWRQPGSLCPTSQPLFHQLCVELMGLGLAPWGRSHLIFCLIWLWKQDSHVYVVLPPSQESWLI